VNCLKGDITLGFCRSCTFITNYSLEPEKNQYDGLYDNSLFYSHLFQSFSKDFVLKLIKRFNLQKKTILEVTVGKVDFLSLFCSLAANNGVKLNPSFINSRDKPFKVSSNVSTVLPQLDDRTKAAAKKVDFVFSYHELEHANSPIRFLNSLKETVGEDSTAIFFVSVPNIVTALQEGDFTDIIYEHPSYFSISSLLFLFNFCGFTVLDIMEDKNALYSSINVVASLNNQTNLEKMNLHFRSNYLEESVLSFSDKTKVVFVKTNNKIQNLLDQGKRIVVWGAGARGVTLLNLSKDCRIEYAVDINPSKQGMFIPGTGQRIVEPKFLITYKPDAVVLANSNYKKEIQEILANLKITTNIILI